MIFLVALAAQLRRVFKPSRMTCGTPFFVWSRSPVLVAASQVTLSAQPLSIMLALGVACRRQPPLAIDAAACGPTTSRIANLTQAFRVVLPVGMARRNARFTGTVFAARSLGFGAALHSDYATAFFINMPYL